MKKDKKLIVTLVFLNGFTLNITLPYLFTKFLNRSASFYEESEKVCIFLKMSRNE